MAAAGAITFSAQIHRTIRRLVLAWTSSAGGAVQEILSPVVSGELLRVVFAPGAGAVQPSANYDVTLLDEDGFDVLGGLGANRSNAAKEEVVPLTGDGVTTNQRRALDGVLDLRVANAGNAKSGTVTLYVR
jgi:hypothetical protein